MKVQQGAVTELRCIRIRGEEESKDVEAFVRWLWPGNDEDKAEDKEARYLLSACCLYVCYTQTDPTLRTMRRVEQLVEMEPDALGKLLLEFEPARGHHHAHIYNAGHWLVCSAQVEQKRWLNVLHMVCAFHQPRKLHVGQASEEATVLNQLYHKKEI